MLAALNRDKMTAGVNSKHQTTYKTTSKIAQYNINVKDSQF